MNKIYEYGDKIYCEKDLSETHDNYGGDLFDLYWDARHGDLTGVLCEETLYYSAYDPETVYETAEELVENYFEDCVVGEVGEQE